MEKIIPQLEAKRLQLKLDNDAFADLIGISPSQWSLLKSDSRQVTWWFFKTTYGKLADNDDESSQEILDMIKLFLSESFAIASVNNHKLQ